MNMKTMIRKLNKYRKVCRLNLFYANLSLWKLWRDMPYKILEEKCKIQGKQLDLMDKENYIDNDLQRRRYLNEQYDLEKDYEQLEYEFQQSYIKRDHYREIVERMGKRLSKQYPSFKF